MKTCRICQQQKPVTAFYRDGHYADGHKADCKPCYGKANVERMQRSAEQTRKQKRAWAQAHPEQVSAHGKRWRNANLVKARARYAAWAAMNRDKVNANDRKRLAIKLKALPQWADIDNIKAIYAKAKLMGRGYHVDHIVPLQSPIVCGLHVECNLQIITAFDNQSKGNKLIQRMFA